MSRDAKTISDNEQIAAGAETIDRAKDALAVSLTRLGDEVERRAMVAIDHATGRVEQSVDAITAMVKDRAEGVARAVKDARDTVDFTPKVRAHPIGAVVGATALGFFFVSLFQRRRVKHMALPPPRPEPPIFSRDAAPKAKIGIVSALAGALVPLLAETALHVARARLAGGLGARGDDGRFQLH